MVLEFGARFNFQVPNAAMALPAGEGEYNEGNGDGMRHDAHVSDGWKA